MRKLLAKTTALTLCALGANLMAWPALAYFECKKDNSNPDGVGAGYKKLNADTTVNCPGKSQAQCELHPAVSKSRILIGMKCFTTKSKITCRTTAPVAADKEWQTGYCDAYYYAATQPISPVYSNCYYKATSGTGYYNNGQGTQTDCDDTPLP